MIDVNTTAINSWLREPNATKPLLEKHSEHISMINCSDYSLNKLILVTLKVLQIKIDSSFSKPVDLVQS